MQKATMQILYRMIVKKSIYKMIVPPDILSKKVEEAFFYLFRLKNTRLFHVFPLRNPSRACIL